MTDSLFSEAPGSTALVNKQNMRGHHSAYVLTTFHPTGFALMIAKSWLSLGRLYGSVIKSDAVQAVVSLSPL